MTEKNQNDKDKKINIVPDAADMIRQLRTVIDTTDDSSYTLPQLQDLMIKNNKHLAEKSGYVAPSTERVYEILTGNELKKLVKEGVLTPSVSDGITYYKI